MPAYRDDVESVHARFADLRARALALQAEIRERLEALEVLKAQLAEHGRPAPQVPEPVEMDVPELDPQASLAEALRLCGELEALAPRLEKERDELGDYVRVLNDGLRGKKTGTLELGPPPRAVPIALRFANVLEWRWLHVWLLALWATAFIIVAMKSREAYGGVGLAMAAGVVALQLRKAWLRQRLLRAGKVARVTLLGADESYTTSYSGVSMPQAKGWVVNRESYSGSEYKSRLRYTTDEGFVGDLVLKGRPYVDGVVLYDPAAPARALCIDAFWGDPTPDHRGGWTHDVGFGVLFRAGAMLAVVVAYAGGMALVALSSGLLPWN